MVDRLLCMQKVDGSSPSVSSEAGHERSGRESEGRHSMSTQSIRDARRRARVAAKEVRRRERKRRRVVARAEGPAGEETFRGVQAWFRAQGGGPSAVRLVRRCTVTGRGRGVRRTWQRSRRKLRDRRRAGKVPGLRRGQW